MSVINLNNADAIYFGSQKVDRIYAGAQQVWPYVWDPASLFDGGVKGFAYDPSASVLYQDSSGTSPITASGQALGAITDVSGNGWTVRQADAGLRPIFVQDAGGRRKVRINAERWMGCADVDLSGCETVTLTAAIAGTTRASITQFLLEHGVGSFTGTGGFSMKLNTSAVGDHGGDFGHPGGYRFMRTGQFERRKDRVVTIQITPGASNDADRLKVWIDGTQYPVTASLSVGTPTVSAFSVRDLTLFASGAKLQHGRFDYFFLSCVGRALSDTERHSLENHARARMTVVPAYEVTNYRLSCTPSLRPEHAAGSPFALAEWDTSATSVDVAYSAPLYATAPGYCYIGVFVDGMYYTQEVCTGLSGTLTVALPPGEKRVALACGLARYENESTAQSENRINGVWVTGATFNSAATRVAPSTAGGLVIYGDSIAIGQGALPLHEKAWVMQVRAAYPDQNVTVEGAGSLALHTDCFYVDALQNMVARISSASPAVVWLAIGTNDYGLNRWTAASFGAAYAELLDALHAALPAAVIYCQTPLVRSVETANVFGSTLEDYRSAIATAVGTRGSYATLIDGTPILTTGDLTDGVHPSTAGHTKIATFVKSVLGI